MNAPARVPGAKAVLSRLLVIRSFAEGRLRIAGRPECEDTERLQAGLDALGRGAPIDCGAGAAPLRFLALRAARLPGEHRLTGSARLFSRPQEGLIRLLGELGVRAEREGDQCLRLRGRGWQRPDRPIAPEMETSSQFASALLLSAWQLPFPLRIELPARRISGSYLALTRTLCARAGMTFLGAGERLEIPAGQEVRAGLHPVPADQGAAYPLAAAAALTGERLLPPLDREQPDGLYPELLAALGVPCREEPGGLWVGRAGVLRPLDWELGEAPDLVPVTAVLCALAPGRSRLRGAPQLAWKESDRIAATAALVRALGRGCEQRADGLVIEGRGGRGAEAPVRFDTDQDHRLAMAAGVALAAGFALRLSDPGVVAKSFPRFWEELGVAP